MMEQTRQRLLIAALLAAAVSPAFAQAPPLPANATLVAAGLEGPRGVIVNVSAIETIYRSYRCSLEVKLKERTEILPVSVAYARQFKSV